MQEFSIEKQTDVLETVQFEFPQKKRMIKMRVNVKTFSLKSMRPLLADRFGADFGHIKLIFNAKNQKKTILDPDLPLYKHDYFKHNLQLYCIQVDIQNEGG